jgi:hypothetical protein
MLRKVARAESSPRHISSAAARFCLQLNTDRAPATVVDWGLPPLLASPPRRPPDTRRADLASLPTPATAPIYRAPPHGGGREAPRLTAAPPRAPPPSRWPAYGGRGAVGHLPREEVVLHARPRGEAGCRRKRARAGEVSERNR